MPSSTARDYPNFPFSQTCNAGCGHAANAPVPRDAIADFIKAFSSTLEVGIDSLHVGELVRERIENDWPCIFAGLQFEPAVEARFANIKAGFDRIRDRARGIERACRAAPVPTLT